MLFGIILGAILLLLWVVFRKPSGLPPGKWGLPLLGYIPIDGKYIDDHLKDFQKKYGDIYIWKFGSFLQVFVHDYRVCRQMFNSPDFIDRPILSLLQNEGGEQLGVAGSNGAVWQVNRRFSLRQLRDLGMGKSGLVTAVHEQAVNLLEEIKTDSGKEKPYTPAVYTAIVNIIWMMIASKQFKSDDPRNKDLRQLIQLLNGLFSYNAIADMFWWLQYLMPKSVFRKWFKLDAMQEAEDVFFKYFDELIEEHQKTLEPTAPRDLMDAYLIEMNEMKTNSEGVRSIEDLKFLLFDMFFAGSDTTNGTMEWLFMYMAAFPDKQKKLQAEIDEVLPQGVMATMEDKARMPYTEAVINEVLRKSSLTNIGVQHSAVRDTTLGGYKIPKDSMMTVAAEAIHHDPRYWDQPNRFLPERWLSPEGKFVMQKEGFLPFGTGKRACIGEGLARMELFVFTTAVMQNFSVSPPEGKQMDLRPNYKDLFGHFCRKQDIVFTARI